MFVGFATREGDGVGPRCGDNRLASTLKIRPHQVRAEVHRIHDQADGVGFVNNVVLSVKFEKYHQKIIQRKVKNENSIE